MCLGGIFSLQRARKSHNKFNRKIPFFLGSQEDISPIPQSWDAVRFKKRKKNIATITNTYFIQKNTRCLNRGKLFHKRYLLIRRETDFLRSEDGQFHQPAQNCIYENLNNFNVPHCEIVKTVTCAIIFSS